MKGSPLGIAMLTRGFVAHSSAASPPIQFLDAKTAQQIDNELMSESGGFKLEQLMELAGLAVASAAQVNDVVC